MIHHPYWLAYGVVVSALHGLLLADIARRGSTPPDERTPPLGYVAWSMLAFLWPVIALLLAVLLITTEI